MALSNTVGRSVITTHTAFASRGFDAMFCEWYDKRMSQLWTDFSPVMDWLKKEGRIEQKKPQGKYIVFPVELYLGGNAGARGEGDTLPTVDSVNTVQGKVDYQKGFKGRFSLSDEAAEWGGRGAGTLADVFEQEVRNVEGGIRNLAAIYAWGDGTGVMAIGASDPAAGTATLTITKSETYAALYPGTRFLYEGMRVHAIQTLATMTDDTAWVSNSTTADADLITSIPNDTSIVMGSSTQDTDDASYYLAPDGSYTSGTAGSQRGPMGLSGIIDDGTFSDTAPNDTAFGCQGLIVSSYPQWKSLVSHNSGTARAVTTDLINQMYFKIARRVGDLSHKPVMWMNPDVLREWVALLEPQIQYQATKLKPGFDAFEFVVNGNAIPVKLDLRCPSNIYFANPDYLTLYNSRPMGIVKYGSQTAIPTANVGAAEYRYWWAWQLATSKRNAHGVIRDVSCTITSV
jgi:hypothetical protein